VRGWDERKLHIVSVHGTRAVGLNGRHNGDLWVVDLTSYGELLEALRARAEVEIHEDALQGEGG